MLSINSYTAGYIPLSSAELALAKEHQARQEIAELIRVKLHSQCEDERAAASETFRQKREHRELNMSQAYQTATGLYVFSGEEAERAFAQRNYNYFKIPEVPKYNLPKSSFSFNAENNSIQIGIGSKIQIGSNLFEVLDNTVTVTGENSRYASALNGLLRAIGTDATFGYDENTLKNTLSLLQELGIDTSRSFWINDTRFEMQDGILRTVGQTAKQEFQFLGIEGLNRLVAQAYQQNLIDAQKPK
ncbi:MAG: hypothetical protein LBI27_03480 [Clostridiales bacterium]|jgi:hypothetical protein|nr:hypothetical protein [Clostridiales bacterium]